MWDRTPSKGGEPAVVCEREKKEETRLGEDVMQLRNGELVHLSLSEGKEVRHGMWGGKDMFTGGSTKPKGQSLEKHREKLQRKLELKGQGGG